MLTVQLTIQYNAALLQNEKHVLQINGKLKKIFIVDTTPRSITAAGLDELYCFSLGPGISLSSELAIAEKKVAKKR